MRVTRTNRSGEQRDWGLADAPDQSGRTAVITGANSGIGLETARGLAALGARVVMACRNPSSAEEARAEVMSALPDAQIDIVTLDLSDLGSVRTAADQLRHRCETVDLIVANAGVLAPARQQTPDGLEMDLGTNFVGHFAFIGELLPRVPAGGRVVTVGSVAHRRGRIDFDDLAMARRFRVSRAYARSKYAQMVFAVELDRRLQAADRPVLSVMAHPGASRTGVMRGHNRFLQWGFHSPKTRPLVRQFIQEPVDGALPTLRAAVDPAVRGGQYYGPAGRLQFTGPPVLVTPKDTVFDRDVARRLWAAATELSGVSYEV